VGKVFIAVACGPFDKFVRSLIGLSNISSILHIGVVNDNIR